jgi:hypothetical protein
MKAALAALSLVVVAWQPAIAGELVFANGSRLTGELSNEVLMVSTGNGLIEVSPDEVVALSAEGVRLRDGRAIRGTLVGGQIKARTALGEIAVKIDELESYRATPESAAAARSAPTAAPAPAAVQATPAPAAPAPAAPATVSQAPGTSDAASRAGLPAMAAYQDPRGSLDRIASPSPGRAVQPVALTREAPLPTPGRRLQAVDESPLYRDALHGAAQVGRVNPGQQVTFVDSIDRRLRILNRLVFDGGHWVKVRAADGTEGWVPADIVREIR